jgi:hypothetical protein
MLERVWVFLIILHYFLLVVFIPFFYRLIKQ